MYLSAILLAAGRGLRIKSRILKPLVKIKAKPILIYSLAVFNKLPFVKEIIFIDLIKSGFRIGKLNIFSI